MIKTFEIEYKHYGKSRLLYVSNNTPKSVAYETELQDFRLQRIKSLNQSINKKGEVSTSILHPLLELSAQNVFTNFMSGVVYAWEQELPTSYLTEESKTNISDLLQSQKKENAIWSFFSRQNYYPDWDDTAIARICFPDQTFDTSQLTERYAKGQFVETWIADAPDSYLNGDIDLCVNLNVLGYLLASKTIEFIPNQIQKWSQRVLQTNGECYFSIYYQSIYFLTYQLAKIFYQYPLHQEKYPKLFANLKQYLIREQLVYNNFLSYMFSQNARAYCQLPIEEEKDINLMQSFLQSSTYYSPSPFFYGPEGWYGATAISDLLVLEYLSLTNNATD